VAIAGGIGSGKTAVTDKLASLGFSVVDADLIAREVVEKGQPAWRALIDAFGSAVLTPEGDIDRKFVADVVFHDASALRRLNHITHGYIETAMRAQLDAASGDVVFVSIPLYRDEMRAELGLSEVWALEVDPEIAVSRLTSSRAMSEDDARARLSTQMSNEQRRFLADRVIENNGTREELNTAIEQILAEVGA
jgi:dephospho-CoA kinase